ncbi:hypothetical protein JCM10213v2_002691 [Rhodosporidiobolus nylandii]
MRPGVFSPEPEAEPGPSGSIDLMDALGAAVVVAGRLEKAIIPDEYGHPEPVDYALYGILGLAALVQDLRQKLPFTPNPPLGLGASLYRAETNRFHSLVNFAIFAPNASKRNVKELLFSLYPSIPDPHDDATVPQAPLAPGPGSWEYPAWVPWQTCMLKRGSKVLPLNVLKGAGLLTRAVARIVSSDRTTLQLYDATALVHQLRKVHHQLPENERYRLGLTEQQWPAEVRLVVSQQGYNDIRELWKRHSIPALAKEAADLVWKGSAPADLVAKYATALEWAQGFFELPYFECWPPILYHLSLIKDDVSPYVAQARSVYGGGNIPFPLTVDGERGCGLVYRSPQVLEKKA